MTLNSFHHSGIAKQQLVHGVPRLTEILDATHAPKAPVTTFWLREPFCRDADFAARFARTLPAVKLGSLVSAVAVVHDPDPWTTSVEADAAIVRIDALLADTETAGAASGDAAASSRYVARLALNRDEMRARDLSPPYLQHLIEDRLGFRAHVVSSETSSLDWCLRLRYHDLRNMLRVVRIEEASDVEVSLVRRITTLLLDQIVVGGHVGVSGAYAREVETWNPATERNETVHVVDALGSVLNSAPLFPAVDAGRSTCNDPHAMCRCLGLEAAVSTIHHEVDAVLCDGGAAKVDRRHVMLVADAMTHRHGVIVPMSRHGLNRADNANGALVRASFEETVDTLFDAAVFSDNEPAEGVTFSVMAGEEARIGTGSFDVLVPEESIHRRPKPSERSRRLAKSTIRGVCSAPAAPPTQAVGYVDPTLWCFAASSSSASANGAEGAPAAARNEMQHPFVDTPCGDAAATDTSTSSSGVPCARLHDSRSARYGMPPTTNGPSSALTKKPVVYTPSSPRVV